MLRYFLGAQDPYKSLKAALRAEVVETRERVEELVMPAAPVVAAPLRPRLLFQALSAEDLLAVGVPQDWIGDVQGASEDAFLALTDHLSAEAGEALLDYAGTGVLRRPAPLVPADPFAHPDALRRFRVVENQEALALALEAPWERWAVFLHPGQQGHRGPELCRAGANLRVGRHGQDRGGVASRGRAGGVVA